MTAGNTAICEILGIINLDEKADDATDSVTNSFLGTFEIISSKSSEEAHALRQ